jgi:hypothetical protein
MKNEGRDSAMVVKDTTDQVTEFELTRAELEKLIDSEARGTLSISGEEFKKRYACGELSDDDPRVRILASLLRLAA